MNHLDPRPVVRSRPARHHGFILIEVLVAAVILAIGLLSLLGFHGVSHRINADAKIQAEAVALAEGKLRELESFLSATDRRLAAGTRTVIVERNLVNYVLSWTVGEHPGLVRALEAEVRVIWMDRDGSHREVVLGAAIDARSPGAGIEDLLAMVTARAAARHSRSWISGSSGGGPDDPHSAESPPGGDGGDAPGSTTESGPEPGPEPAVRELTIAGRLRNDTENPAPDIEIGTVDIDAHLADQANCETPTVRTFSCKVQYRESSPGWSGQLVLTSNGVFCETLRAELTLAFFGITSDQTDITLAVASSASRCGQ